MPRDIGTGLYRYPAGTEGNTAQTIFSARYNTFINDLANTLNQALPINMGGTGADNATAGARQPRCRGGSAQTVTNYDTHVWESGSFWSRIAGNGSAAVHLAHALLAYELPITDVHPSVCRACSAAEMSSHRRRHTISAISSRS